MFFDYFSLLLEARWTSWSLNWSPVDLIDRISYFHSMKKYLLIIFIVVACFHDAIESKLDLQSKARVNSVNITIHSQIDHTFESTSSKNDVEKSFLNIQVVSHTAVPKKLHFKIWKPPVINSPFKG